MTREEKISRLEAMCEKYTDCCKCPLECACITWDYATDEELDKEYEKAFPKLEPKPEPKPDMVNHPPHYTQGGMECIEEMIQLFGRQATMNFCLLNAWKYRKRALHKNGQQDLDKSDWYIAKYVELKKEDMKDGEGKTTDL